MAYWWVNHDKMHKAEIAGGYIWCPQNTDKIERVGYANLTLVNEGDVVFSYANQKVGHVGIATSSFNISARPSDPGYSDKHRDWQADGWRVSIKWELAKNPISPKQHLDELAPYPGQRHGALRDTGDGKEAMYLSAVPSDVGEKLMGLVKHQLVKFPFVSEEDDEEQIHRSQLKETEKKALIDARIGQGKFRRDVINLHKRCPITGVDNPDLLVASHIKAWKRPCTNLERLDPHNGLLLAPHIDKLFDRGFISFSSEGKLLVRDKTTKAVLAQWGIALEKRITITGNAQLGYLDYHRKQHKFSED